MDYTKYEGHTSGPWRAIARKHLDGSISIESGDEADPTALAEVSRANHKTLDELLTNAGLIAAAPDLLERCKRLEAALMGWILEVNRYADGLEGEERDHDSFVQRQYKTAMLLQPIHPNDED